jgi:hypothetical protein
LDFNTKAKTHKGCRKFVEEHKNLASNVAEGLLLIMTKHKDFINYSYYNNFKDHKQSSRDHDGHRTWVKIESLPVLRVVSSKSWELRVSMLVHIHEPSQLPEGPLKQNNTEYCV